MKYKKFAIAFALLAALLYGINVPVSKLLLNEITPTMLAGFLYLGAGAGTGALMITKRACRVQHQEKLLEKSDLPYTIAMVILDIAAPIFLMYGIANTTSSNVSLLNNFEIAATTIIAFVFFKEKISKKLLLAIILVLCASVVLSFEGQGAFVLNKGSLFVLLAASLWGLENNCTRCLSENSSEQIVFIKGIFSGAGSIVTALVIGERFPEIRMIVFAMLLGFVSYGLSINFYIKAQKHLGASKTSAFYSACPFFGVLFAFLLLGDKLTAQFFAGLVLMILSTVVMIKDTLENAV